MIDMFAIWLYVLFDFDFKHLGFWVHNMYHSSLMNRMCIAGGGSWPPIQDVLIRPRNSLHMYVVFRSSPKVNYNRE